MTAQRPKAGDDKAPRDANPAKSAKKGRPQKWSDKQIEATLTLMGQEGITLKEAAKKRRIPYAAVKRRMGEDPRLRDLHARAREEFADECVQKMFHIAKTEPDVNRARLLVDATKWYAARVLPKRYGDHQTLEIKDDSAQAPISHLEFARELLFELELADRERAAQEARDRPRPALTYVSAKASE